MQNEKVFDFGDKRWNKQHGCYEILEDDGQETGGVWRLEKEYRGSDAPLETAQEPDSRAGLDFVSGGIRGGLTEEPFGDSELDEDEGYSSGGYI